MEHNRFGGMAKALGASTARRGALGLLAALGIGWAAGGAEAVAASKNTRNRRKQRRRRNRNRQRAAAGCAVEHVECSGECFPECCPGDTRPCYTGPAATRNVGVCRDGSEICTRGRWSGVCGGEATPTFEACNGLDDDCDGVVDGGFAAATCGPFRTCADGRCCGVANAPCSKPADCCSGSCAGFFCAA